MSQKIHVSCDQSLPYAEVSAVDIKRQAIRIVSVGRPSFFSLSKLIMELSNEKYKKVESGKTIVASKESNLLAFGSTDMYGDWGVHLAFRTTYKGDIFYATVHSGRNDSWIVDQSGIYKVVLGTLWQKEGERKAVWFNANGEELTPFFQKRYLISGTQAAVFDLETDRVERVCTVPELSLYFDSIDAGVRNLVTNQLYVFSGDKFMAIDMHTGQPLFAKPLPIKPHPVHIVRPSFLPIASSIYDAWDALLSRGFWAGMPFSSIDAACAYQDKLFFFKDTQYARFDLKDEDNGIFELNPSGYPRQIHPNTWPGLGYTSVQGACSNTSGTKMYLFSGDTYVRFDMPKDKADENYPMSTQKNWSGLPFSTITAAF